MIATDETAREGARQFLDGLKEYFNATWKVDKVKQEMQEHEQKARSKNPKLRDVPHETHFLANFVVPAIHGYLSTLLPKQHDDARRALLAEGYLNCQTMASGSPASSFKYPFTKQFSAVGKVVESWWNGSQVPCTANPDFALRPPCPYKVVGETKYFRKGGVDAAKTELVRGVYQCFYYRGLPRVLGSERRPAWEYDYACLLAYDASGNDTLTKAWGSVAPKVKAACWNSANIFVMLLP